MILFVGDKPSPKMKPGAKPFEGAACEKRFKEWVAYLGADWNAVNRVDSHFGIWILWAIDDNRPIIALGTAASKALGNTPHFKLPHPSGRNRQINNKSYIDTQLKKCKEWLKSQGK